MMIHALAHNVRHFVSLFFRLTHTRLRASETSRVKVFQPKYTDKDGFPYVIEKISFWR